MNLMKSFNLKYLIQNLKKSKVVLSIFIGLIPILNTIIEIMNLSTNKTEILSFNNISSLTLLGTFILPIIISICLFNYIYKKKSVDFINSMPISRKNIFITNTILGIIIMVLTILLNSILTLIVCLILNRPIPLTMLLDYFVYFSLVYIFIFTTTNLAMTISGNAITQVIVTSLLLFLVPYISVFSKALISENNTTTYLKCTTEECKPTNYYCYEDETCINNQKNNLYSLYLSEIKETTYTAPFSFVFNPLIKSSPKTNLISTLKMFILSIIYIILGYKQFIKRKMEVNETTFKNIHHHNLVKSLTLVPIASIAYYLLDSASQITIVYAITIMVIYFLIYDLITKKSLTNLKLTSLYFIITIIITVSTCYYLKNTSKDFTLNYKDITSIAIDLSNEVGYSNKEKLYISDKQLISLIIKSGLNTSDYTYNGFEIFIKTKNNEEYNTHVSLDEESYKKILSQLDDNKSYINTYKNINKDNVCAIKVGNKLYTNKEKNNYINIINNTLKDLDLEEFINIQNKNLYLNEVYNIVIYSYENHDRQTKTITGYIDYKLLNKIVNDYNKELFNNISNTKKEYYIYHNDSYYNPYSNLDYYVLKSAKNEIYKFILKNKEEQIDMEKPYYSFNIELAGKDYIYTTNKVEEINDILNHKYLEIKDTKEYKEYYGIKYEPDGSYYD